MLTHWSNLVDCRARWCSAKELAGRGLNYLQKLHRAARIGGCWENTWLQIPWCAHPNWFSVYTFRHTFLDDPDRQREQGTRVCGIAGKTAWQQRLLRCSAHAWQIVSNSSISHHVCRLECQSLYNTTSAQSSSIKYFSCVNCWWRGCYDFAAIIEPPKETKKIPAKRFTRKHINNSV